MKPSKLAMSIVLLSVTSACSAGTGGTSGLQEAGQGDPATDAPATDKGGSPVALSPLEQRLVGAWTMRRKTVRNNDEYLYFVFRSDGSGCYWEREYTYSATSIRRFSSFSLDESKQGPDGGLPILLDGVGGYRDVFRPKDGNNGGDAVLAFGLTSLRLTRDSTKEECPAN